jgi:hypothetical protein
VPPEPTARSLHTPHSQVHHYSPRLTALIACQESCSPATHSLCHSTRRLLYAQDSCSLLSLPQGTHSLLIAQASLSSSLLSTPHAYSPPVHCASPPRELIAPHVSRLFIAWSLRKGHSRGPRSSYLSIHRPLTTQASLSNSSPSIPHGYVSLAHCTCLTLELLALHAYRPFLACSLRKPHSRAHRSPRPTDNSSLAHCAILTLELIALDASRLYIACSLRKPHSRSSL